MEKKSFSIKLIRNLSTSQEIKQKNLLEEAGFLK